MSTPTSRAVALLQDHDLVHEDALRAWDDNRSVAVISPHHAVFDGREELIAAYDGPPALITWTTGTTGIPKGVIIPWAAVDVRCQSLAQYWNKATIEKTASLISPCQSIGVVTSRLAVCRSGGNYVVEVGAGVTCLIGSPRILMAITRIGHPLNTVETEQLEAMKKSLRLVIACGHKLEQADRNFLEQTFSVPVVEYYGTSETGAIAIDGMLLQGCEARINEGRIQVRTDGFASGYLGVRSLPMQDGWFVTPDRGMIEDGKLICLGRD